MLTWAHSNDSSNSFRYGSTPLYVAAMRGYASIVSTLIDAEVDVDTPNVNGETPLFAAAQFGDMEVCTLLVEAGANVMLKTNPGAFEWEDGKSPWEIAFDARHLDVAEMLRIAERSPENKGARAASSSDEDTQSEKTKKSKKPKKTKKKKKKTQKSKKSKRSETTKTKKMKAKKMKGGMVAGEEDGRDGEAAATAMGYDRTEEWRKKREARNNDVLLGLDGDFSKYRAPMHHEITDADRAAFGVDEFPEDFKKMDLTNADLGEPVASFKFDKEEDKQKMMDAAFAALKEGKGAKAAAEAANAAVGKGKDASADADIAAVSADGVLRSKNGIEVVVRNREHPYYKTFNRKLNVEDLGGGGGGGGMYADDDDDEDWDEDEDDDEGGGDGGGDGDTPAKRRKRLKKKRQIRDAAQRERDLDAVVPEDGKGSVGGAEEDEDAPIKLGGVVFD